jgi:hypothetical protein
VGIITKILDTSTIGGDVYLSIDAYNNGLPWGWHAYDATIGAVSMMGMPGTVTANTVDSYVGAAKYLNSFVNWINTTGQQMMINKIIWRP